MVTKTIIPTRTELARLKARLKAATRSHTLLKTKRDGLGRQLLETARRAEHLRTRVDEGLSRANDAFTMAGAVMSPDVLEQSLLCPNRKIQLSMTLKNILSVHVPEYTCDDSMKAGPDALPYGYAMTSGELDDAISALSAVFADMLSLAQFEKTAQLLADELETTRHRVSALEHIVIPEMQASIRHISMKLEEHDRAAKARLMKAREMVPENAHDVSDWLEI